MAKSLRPGRRAQLVFLAVLLMGSAAIAWAAWRIEGWPTWASAGAFPLGVVAIMIGALLWDMLKTARQADTGGAFRPFVSGNWCGLLALGVLFVVLLGVIGFIGASVFFLWATMVFLHRGRPWFALLLALIITALIYALFTLIFKVSLP